MSSEHDLERAVRTWLRDGLDRLPDRYLDAALDEIATTNQRQRRSLTWRPSEMNAFARFGLAAAAAILVAALGWTLLFNGGPLTPAASATPHASATSPASSDAKQLEALLPNTVGGMALDARHSATGSEWVDQNQDGDANLVNWVTSAGKSLDDVSEAIAVGPISSAPNNGPQAEIEAFRVNGVDHTVLISTFQTATKPRYSGPWTTTILSGKTVQCRWGSADLFGGSGGQCLYGTADIIFIVSATDRALVAKALAALP